MILIETEYKPFFLEYYFDNESKLKDLIDKTGKNEIINIYTNMDEFSLIIETKDGGIQIDDIKVSDQIYSIFNKIRNKVG